MFVLVAYVMLHLPVNCADVVLADVVFPKLVVQFHAQSADEAPFHSFQRQHRKW